MEENEPKKLSWFERVESHVPPRIQNLMLAMVALTLCGAITVFGSAYTVNHLKNVLVETAREEARQSADMACEAIRMVVQESRAGSMKDLINHPEIRREMEVLTREGSVLLASVLDENGNIIFQQFCEGAVNEDALRSLFPGLEKYPEVSSDGLPAFHLTMEDLKGSVIPMSVPILKGETQIGEVQIGLAANPSLTQIDNLSQKISSSLIIMVLVVFTALLISTVLLYLFFERQIELQQLHTEAKHMASIGALASGLAHEIRNPLHAMNLHLSVASEDMESGDSDPDEVVSTIHRVQRQIDSLNGIVTTFLSAASPPRMEMQQMRLDQLIREVIAFLKPDLDSRKIEIQSHLNARISINGDTRALHQVLLNVLINAQKILEPLEDRRIEINMEFDRKRCRVYIDDSGPGVAKNEEEAIFKTFVSKRAGGTGFGLSIARRIMEAHGGKIGVRRSPLGGARFYLEFPGAHVRAGRRPNSKTTSIFFS